MSDAHEKALHKIVTEWESWLPPGTPCKALKTFIEITLHDHGINYVDYDGIHVPSKEELRFVFARYPSIEGVFMETSAKVDCWQSVYLVVKEHSHEAYSMAQEVYERLKKLYPYSIDLIVRARQDRPIDAPVPTGLEMVYERDNNKEEA